MSNKLSTDINNTCQTVESKWDKAIKDADSEIKLLATRKARLELALKIFKANKRDGVPWPGENQPQKVG